MNLKDFSLLKEDDDSYTVGHPDGKSMRVPKSGLSEKATKIISSLKNHANFAHFAQGTPEGTDDVENEQGEAIPINLSNPTIPANFTGIPANQAPTGPVAEDTTPFSFTGGTTQYGTNAALTPTPPSISDSDTIPTSSAAPSAATEIPAAQPQPLGSQPPERPLAPNQTGALESAEAAEQGALKTQANIGASQQKAYTTAATQLAALPTSQQLYDDFQAKDKQFSQALANNQIDPQRYLHNMDTGSKIAAGIALVLGGIGSGLSRQPNLAAQQIDNAISADVDAQKNDQSKIMNLWKMNHEAYGTASMADLATRNQILSVAENSARAAAAQAPAAIAQERLAPVILGMEQQKNLNNWMMSRLQGGASGTEQQHLNEMQVMQQVRPDFYKEMQNKYIPSVGTSQVPLSEKDKEAVKTYQVLNNAVDKAINFAQQEGTTLPGTAKNAEANAIRQDLVTGFQTLHGLNRLSDVDLQLNLSNIASPGAFRTSNAIAQFKTLKDEIENKRNVEYNQLGITPFTKSPIDEQANLWARQNVNSTDPVTQAKATQILNMQGGR